MSEIYLTKNGTKYLKNPSVHLVSSPLFYQSGLPRFLAGFQDLDFPKYLEDDWTNLYPSESIVKVAGQLCYMSFGEERTKNKDAERYIDNLKSSGHGSVLEHVNFGVLMFGIDRSVTHELVRHRAGFGFSQVSQRYVSGKTLRFVERREYQNNPELHEDFERHIDYCAGEYARRAQKLMDLQSAGYDELSAEYKRDLRKNVNQVARSVLPNEVEAPIFVTGNARAWRHFIEMRGNKHADTAIRDLAVSTWMCLKNIAPLIFNDYVAEPDRTGFTLSTKYRKV